MAFTLDRFDLDGFVAATLAEDLFRAGRLVSVAIDARPPHPVRRVRDFESFLDELAVVQPATEATGAYARSESAPGEPVRVAGVGRRNVITFLPDGANGVAAHVDGEKAAAT